MNEYFAMLGGTLALIIHYKSLIHAPNSEDVIRAVFKNEKGEYYKLQPRVVPC